MRPNRTVGKAARAAQAQERARGGSPTIRTLCSFRKGPSHCMLGSTITVRLHRSMTSTPSLVAPITSGLKAPFISGAPPVMSSVSIEGEAASTWSTRATVSSDIVSVRFGDDSTWQWLHAWLQYSPTLTCSIVVARRGSSSPLVRSPRSARKELNSGTPIASSARRRFLFSSSVSRF